ncbi:MAG: hypothetical protein QW803_12120 [Candidatus Methanomethylicia archaeon]
MVDKHGKFGHFNLVHPEKLNESPWDDWEKMFEAVEVEEPESETELPKPWEVSIIEEALAFLGERLPKVYGIEKYDKILVQSLKENPMPLGNPNALHAFIKSMAPRAYDSHLSAFVISPLYAKFPNLPQAIAKYVESTSQSPPPMPMYTPQVPYQPYLSNPYQQYSSYYYTTPLIQYYTPPKPPKTYKIVVDGQEIETDESGYMAWQRFLREREEYERRKQEHELNMKKLEAEIKKITEETERKKEPTVPVKIGDKEIQVPAYLAPLYLKTDDESKKEIEKLREELHKKEVEIIKKELEELKKRPNLIEELTIYEEIAKRLGFQKGGRTTADLLDSIVDRIDQRAAQLLDKISTISNTWKPEVKRTPEERVKKAEEIKKKLEKSEEILKLEEELIKSVANLKPRGGQVGEITKSI